ncbi:Hypothetical predicted protein [Pelobates cultripes]|uniref:Uncharacterized protein n=1 Tax=Pelobates cultripes TaxID=61616 RepID=A0AAD1WKP9_PELCU|nr:Hypothetical predicted protein [Pelobates cultripes]
MCPSAPARHSPHETHYRTLEPGGRDGDTAKWRTPSELSLRHSALHTNQPPMPDAVNHSWTAIHHLPTKAEGTTTHTDSRDAARTRKAHRGHQLNRDSQEHSAKAPH